MRLMRRKKKLIVLHSLDRPVVRVIMSTAHTQGLHSTVYMYANCKENSRDKQLSASWVILFLETHMIVPRLTDTQRSLANTRGDHVYSRDTGNASGTSATEGLFTCLPGALLSTMQCADYMLRHFALECTSRVTISSRSRNMACENFCGVKHNLSVSQTTFIYILTLALL